MSISQSHTALKQWSWDLNLHNLALESTLLHTSCLLSTLTEKKSFWISVLGKATVLNRQFSQDFQTLILITKLYSLGSEIFIDSSRANGHEVKSLNSLSSSRSCYGPEISQEEAPTLEAAPGWMCTWVIQLQRICRQNPHHTQEGKRHKFLSNHELQIEGMR